jgi:hypothetical protein
MGRRERGPPEYLRPFRGAVVAAIASPSGAEARVFQDGQLKLRYAWMARLREGSIVTGLSTV